SPASSWLGAGTERRPAHGRRSISECSSRLSLWWCTGWSTSPTGKTTSAWSSGRSSLCALRRPRLRPGGAAARRLALEPGHASVDGDRQVGAVLPCEQSSTRLAPDRQRMAKLKVVEG